MLLCIVYEAVVFGHYISIFLFSNAKNPHYSKFFFYFTTFLTFENVINTINLSVWSDTVVGVVVNVCVGVSSLLLQKKEKQKKKKDRNATSRKTKI